MAVDLHRPRPPHPDRFGIAWLGVVSLALSLTGSAGSAHAQPPGNRKAAAPPIVATDAEGEAKAETGLPPGYEPPRDPPKMMLEEKNLLTPEEQVQFGKELGNKYAKRVRNADLRSDEAKLEVRNGIRYRLNELTLAKNRRELQKFRQILIQDMRNAGSVAKPKVDVLREFRRQLLTIVVEETEKLFDNNYYVRLQAAILLGELNWMEEDLDKGVAREAFSPAAKPLCRVIQDPEQPEFVKIASVLSLTRIVRQGNPNVEQKREVATAVVAELKRTESHYWYQTRLAEVLGSIDVSLDLNRDPFVFNMLNSVLNDRQRDLRVRVQAAWSLGRHPLAPQVDLQRLTVDIANVGLDLAKEHAAKPNQAHWKRCSLTLYFAFKAKNKSDVEATKQREGGLLNNPAAAAPAKEAYGQVLPVITSVLKGEAVAPEQIQALQKWRESKAPTKNKPEINPMGDGPPE